jgi:hypothetical protein
MPEPIDSIITAFKVRFPDEFDPIVVDARLPILEPYYYDIYPKPWGIQNSWNRKILLLLAHYLWIDQLPSQQQVGSFTSSSAGNVSGTFALPKTRSDIQSFLEASKYGNQYLAAAAKRVGALFV